jgi:hypothetical protein
MPVSKTVPSISDMAAIGQLIRTQDNRITADPFFIVQERRRFYGMDMAYDPEIAWLYADESVEVDAEEAKRLEAQYQRHHREPEGFRRVGYVEKWVYVFGCFTEAAADWYIAHNSHRHSGRLRTYVDSLYRNPEMIAVREYLLSLAEVEAR